MWIDLAKILEETQPYIHIYSGFVYRKSRNNRKIAHRVCVTKVKIDTSHKIKQPFTSEITSYVKPFIDCTLSEVQTTWFKLKRYTTTFTCPVEVTLRQDNNLTVLCGFNMHCYFTFIIVILCAREFVKSDELTSLVNEKRISILAADAKASDGTLNYTCKCFYFNIKNTRIQNEMCRIINQRLNRFAFLLSKSNRFYKTGNSVN